MQIDFKTAKTLCTASEYALLQDARPKSLTQLSVPELKKKAARARMLSDKWRDLSRSQGRSSDGAAARSAQKQDLFTEALARFAGRLAKASGGASPATKVPAKKAVAAKAVVKQTAKKTVAKKSVAKKAAKKAPAAAKMPKMPAAKKSSQKSKSLDHTAKAEQHGRRSALRIAASGLSTRVRGHVSARGRRDQAARSSRKRS